MSSKLKPKFKPNNIRLLYVFVGLFWIRFSDGKSVRTAKTKAFPSKTKGSAKLGKPCCGGKRWIRTTEVSDDRFTVCSLWPLGNLPMY